MDASPLTQEARPQSFEPKIVQLYLSFFNAPANEANDEAQPSEGFWTELFLLNPDKRRLYEILKPRTAGELLQIQVCFACWSVSLSVSYVFPPDTNPSLLPTSNIRSRIRNNTAK